MNFAPKILIWTSSFGFGPSAAAANFHGHLRTFFDHIGFAGKGHAFDLQRNLRYEALYDTAQMDENDIGRMLEEYDYVLICGSLKKAKIAKKAGLKVFFYDDIAWAWPDETIKQLIETSDLYFAQDFFDVEERLAKFSEARNVRIISPIVCRDWFEERSGRDDEYIVLNFGGLQNPLIDTKDMALYATQIAQSAHAAFPGKRIVMCGSNAIARALPELPVQTIPYHDMPEFLSKAEFAMMTPGLGNIHRAAASNIPTIWLPPANATQGIQLNHLEKYGFTDASLDWSKFTDSQLDYRGDEAQVMQSISAVWNRLITEPSAQNALTSQMREAAAGLQLTKSSKVSAVLDYFSSNGGAEMCKWIIERVYSDFAKMEEELAMREQRARFANALGV